MQYEFDASKTSSNLAKHGVSFSEAEAFDWGGALVREDVRKPYSERRFQAVGYLNERLHVMVFCLRADVVRVISSRKANLREVNDYAKT